MFDNRSELQDGLDKLRMEVESLQHGEKTKLEQERAAILDKLRSEVSDLLEHMLFESFCFIFALSWIYCVLFCSGLACNFL